ncbi:MAG: RNA polymerase sigma factor [Bacteroidales bacterium]
MDFDKFYKDNYSSIFSFCLQWTGNSDDAKDIAQETFTELFETIAKQSNITNPRAWAYRVAYNRCINLHKKKQRFTQCDISEIQTFQTKDDSLEKREQYRKIRAAMNKLNEKEKTLVILYKERFSYKEMATVVEMNEKSVGKTLARAITKISSLLN